MRVQLVIMIVCWAVVVGTWLVGLVVSLRSSPHVIRRVGRRREILVALGVVIVIALLGRRWRTFSTPDGSVEYVGVVLMVASTALAIWARTALGLMWAATPATREHHQLRTSGPYAFSRHPIYLAFWGLLLGSTLIEGNRWAIALVYGLIVFGARARTEDRLMSEQFGQEYERCRDRVGVLAPRRWLHRWHRRHAARSKAHC